MNTHGEGDDERPGSSEDWGVQWDFAPASGEGLSSALKRLKKLERARAMLQGGANAGRASERDGPSNE